MNKFLIKTLLILICLSHYAWGQETVSEAEKNDFIEDIAHYQIYLDEVGYKKDQVDYLTLSKISMLNGDINRAIYFINKIQKPNKKLRHVIQYYRALIAFIKSDFKTSYDLLNVEEFYASNAYPNVCVLKLANMMALPEIISIEMLESELTTCKIRTDKYTKNFHYWIDTLAMYRININEIVNGRALNDYRYVLNTKETAQLWLKAGLILNKEEVLKKYIPFIGEEFYRYRNIRELIGLVYFRLGDNDKAFSFVEDLNSPNAENIKGLIRLENNQLELALGHFQLALTKKETSFNALSKGLALSWLLEQFELGSDLLDKLQGEQLKWQQKMAFKGSFYAQIGEYKKLNELTNILEREYKKLKPTEVELLRNFNGAITDNVPQFEDGGHEACRKHDGVSCWLIHKVVQDPSFTYSMKRDENIREDLNIDLNELTSSVNIQKRPEIPLIYQEDIEELDSFDSNVQGYLLDRKLGN